MEPATFGVLHTQTIQSFAVPPRTAPYRGVDSSSPKLTQCIKRGSEIALTAKGPGFEASLVFDSASKSGLYRLHLPHERQREEGSVINVSIPDSEESFLINLSQYPVRFVVATEGGSAGQMKRFWFVGITQFSASVEVVDVP